MLVVVAAEVVTEVLDADLTDDIMGFIVVAETGFTDAISIFSVTLSALILNTKYRQVDGISKFLNASRNIDKILTNKSLGEYDFTTQLCLSTQMCHWIYTIFVLPF